MYVSECCFSVASVGVLHLLASTSITHGRSFLQKFGCVCT